MMIPSLIGNLPDWDRIREIADKHGLLVVEDSADTLGATLRGTSTGNRSHISTTSFYGSHVINAAGNGGMICINDDELGRRALLLRSWAAPLRPSFSPKASKPASKWSWTAFPMTPRSCSRNSAQIWNRRRS